MITKRAEYANRGLDHYWIVDPTAPSVTVYRRSDNGLQQVSRVIGTDELSVDEPFRLAFAPAALIY